MMNTKAQTLGLAILSALFIIIVGLMTVNYLMPEINTFRLNLNCSTPSEISDGVKVLCLVTDATIPYYIVTVFTLAIGGIIARFAIN